MQYDGSMEINTALTPHQQLAIDYVRAMDVPSQLTKAAQALVSLDAPELRAHEQRFIAAALKRLSNEMGALTAVVEELYTEEELRFLMELSKHPHWMSVQEKGPHLLLATGDILRRTIEAASADLDAQDRSA